MTCASRLYLLSCAARYLGVGGKLFLKEDDTAVDIFIFVKVCGYETRQLPLVSMILLAVVLGVVLLVASYVFRTVRQQWAIITALKQLPCDPEYHWLWGHTQSEVFQSNFNLLHILSHL